MSKRFNNIICLDAVSIVCPIRKLVPYIFSMQIISIFVVPPLSDMNVVPVHPRILHFTVSEGQNTVYLHYHAVSDMTTL